MADFYLGGYNTNFGTGVPAASGLSVGTGDFSISFRFQFGANANISPVYWVNSGLTPIFWLSWETSNSRWMFWIMGTTGPVISYFSWTYDTNWHNMVITCDRDSVTGLKMFIDKVQVGTSQDITGASAYSDTLWFAEFFGAVSNASFIAMDDFRLYIGAVLSTNQIAYIYTEEKVVESGFAAITSNGWYSEFDDGSGTTFSGRLLSSGVWSDKNGVINQYNGNAVQWYAGGFPFNSGIGAGVVIMDGQDEQWSF